MSRALGQRRHYRQHEGGLALAGVALDDGQLSQRDVGIPQPPHFLCLYILHGDQLQIISHIVHLLPLAEPLSGKSGSPLAAFMIEPQRKNLHGKGTLHFFRKVPATEEVRTLGKKREPGIYLLTDTGNNVEIILTWMDGRETRLPRQSPAEALVDFVGFDFGDYRSQVEELWEEHCVFEERDEVPYADYEDFAAQAVPLAELLHAAAPTAYWDVQHYAALAEGMTDDGEPIFASRKAFAVLTALRRPYFLQNRMRNIFESAFADFERGTQQERFRALENT